MILIGTSGFQYKDWRGTFYPKGLPERFLLAYYAERFRALELNFSYYTLPTAETSRRLLERSSGRLEFVVKAHRSMTHTRDASEADYEAFLRGVKPLQEAGRLGACLVQFPFAFRKSRSNARYILELSSRLSPLRVVVEFRHSSWACQETFEFLRRHGLALCCVDGPRLEGLMPPVALTTSSIGYVRFHGRNARKWWNHKETYERYDYLYTEEELREWVPRLREMEASCQRLYVFMNNHYQAKAVENALMLEELLASSGQRDHEGAQDTSYRPTSSGKDHLH